VTTQENPTTEAGTVEASQQSTDTTPTNEVDVQKLIEERDKWQHFARVHEDKWKALSQETEELRRANLSEADRAIADAEARGRQAAAAEFGGTLAEAELRTQAALAGAEIPETVSQYLDINRFVGSDGMPDKAAIASFVSSLSPAPKQPRFPQNVGIGPQGGGTGVPQLTREDLPRMTAEQINQAREEGRLNSLLYGEP
jgi:hypothetical protein